MALSNVVLLHGDLELHIIQARNLPNMDLFSEALRRCFGFCGLPLPCRSPPSSPRSVGDTPVITSDPYVAVLVAGSTVARTNVIPNVQNPRWHARFKIPLAHYADTIEFHVKDDDVVGAQLIGTATIPASRVASGEPFSDWVPVIPPPGRSRPPPGPDLLVELQFVPVRENALYHQGIPGDPEKLGVRDTYFPLRKGGMVTLYQDAHVRDGELPVIKLDDQRVFKHEKCWEDICRAILEARHLIYIVGWSIYHKVRLVRESASTLPNGGNLTLGELLKFKSDQGIPVRMLVWDDKTSRDINVFRKEGVMQTHDEETKKYFKHSSVICVLSPRSASSKLSIIKQKIVGTVYTHHQKCVIVDTQLDTQLSQSTRKITAFIGGLDLCDGRYDTPKHRLFQNLDFVFSNDIHNPTFDVQTKGPRQPWHDLHCKIEGPAAYDVLTNFEQRWQNSTKFWSIEQQFKKLTLFHDDALIKIDQVSSIVSPSKAKPYGDPTVQGSKEEDSENWHVQVFRSIDSGSVKGFPTDFHEAKAKNLACGKNVVIDKSIHSAYVRAIRSAQRFIYIENQYFIGSSYGWPNYANPDGAGNLIPMELALKIAQKIEERERFAVYIVIPMWPEGAPSSSPVQEILFWQAETIKMMYGIIAKKLKLMNLGKAHPKDYLNFYCLGNRELQNGTSDLTNEPSEDNAMALARKHRRFMIYVHAKGMIIDDEYVILGSANINQRSLDGSRDTEIAMGAYQPHHTWASNRGHPHGQIYGYRKSLWAEHLGEVDNPLFEEPHSLECVEYVNSKANNNWTRYIGDELVLLEGHLLRYPINVEADGSVGPLRGHERFPDVGGKVLGEQTSLPDILTM
ncbi:phospholipase D delta-like isoform X1 [Ananas comosus]|uniref:Phospholipase D n=1 Tax=Ananas comosus TaxID=4615 RepID=A0A6P5EJB0_ANACO|nr:phospholipase D delta-like isoform X1 [Ananas comosus]